MTDATAVEHMITLEVARYFPEDGRQAVQRYEVPYHADWVVLDALNDIKDRLDGSLSYRWSCRMGVCGSCGMMVNGEPKLTCAVFLRDYLPGPIRVEPLANFPIERDLVVVLDDFLAKLHSVSPWIIRREEKPLVEGEYRQTPAELARYEQFSGCINCLLCYAACPISGLEEDFIGPAALAIAHRYNLDSRDQGSALRAATVASDDGIWDCTLVGECSVVCPKDVDPAGAIQQLKLSSTVNWYKSFLRPLGIGG